MKRTVTDWEAAVCVHRGLPARAGMIGLWLARQHQNDMQVSVPESEIRAAFGGISRDTVTKSIKQLREAGLLKTIRYGRQGTTAVYGFRFPTDVRDALGGTAGMTDAAREAVARARRQVTQRPDVPDAQTTYMSPDVADAETGDSDRTWRTPRIGELHPGDTDDPPWSEQEPAGDEEREPDRIDEFVEGLVPDEVGLSQGAKRPAPPEAQRVVSPEVKKALEDWGVHTPVEANTNRSGGRAA